MPIITHNRVFTMCTKCTCMCECLSVCVCMCVCVCVCVKATHKKREWWIPDNFDYKRSIKFRFFLNNITTKKCFQINYILFWKRKRAVHVSASQQCNIKCNQFFPLSTCPSSSDYFNYKKKKKIITLFFASTKQKLIATV